MTAMVEGKRYLIVYRRWNGRVNDELVGVYLGEGPQGHLISLRPRAGTTELLHEQVQSVEETTASVMLPRRHRVAA